MASTSPAHLFKDKYSNTSVSDVLLENQKLREKDHEKCLLLERFYCKTYHLWVSLQKPSSEWTSWSYEQKQEIARTSQSHLAIAAALGSPHLLRRSCLEDKVFLSCLERDAVLWFHVSKIA